MKIIKDDVLVIGGGVAACVAAETVIRSGKHVTMMFPNGGHSEISAGTVDILGVIPGENPLICEDYKAGIAALVKQYPEHNYAKSAGELENGIDVLVSLAGEGGYPLIGFGGKNVWVPNMMGTFSVNAYVPATMSEAVVVPGQKERVLVVGVRGNAAFNAQAAALSYQQYQKKLNGQAEYYSTEIHLTGWGDRQKVSDGELADYLDTKDGLAEFISAIKTLNNNERYHFDKILFPPVLGYLHYNEIFTEIKAVCGCKVGEIAALGNSVIGYRFTRALYRSLEIHGANLLRGAKAEAITAIENGVEVTCTIGLTDQLHPGITQTITAPAVILATGGFVGGGIKARKTEVWVEVLNKNLGMVTAGQLDRDVVSTGGQEFMRMGVTVNEDMSVSDEACRGYIFACGDVMAGHNFASERSGAGIAAASACLAAKKAAAIR